MSVVLVIISVVSCSLLPSVSSDGLRIRNGQLEVWSGREYQSNKLLRSQSIYRLDTNETILYNLLKHSL